MAGFRDQIDFSTIAQSASVSGVFDLTGRRDSVVFLPQSLGANAFVQVATDTLSASFVRALTTDATSFFEIASYGNAGRAFSMHDVGPAFAYMRIETGAPTTDVRSIMVQAKH
ncbi:MAG: hypothetical protein HY613_02450 [Candidatus Rokubacteria bacterium]|nr:hypothetical protein [Candidatus Rokubacteria bacterium]